MKTIRCKNRKLPILTLLAALWCYSVNAAFWFVDSSVSTSGNGVTWGTAWKNISNITGVAAGDTIYISGGPSGSSQSYPVLSGWASTAGVAGNPITYQIGQDVQHNGMAIFTGSGVFFGNNINPINVAFVGDAGDGSPHFRITGFSEIIEDNNSGRTLSNWRFAYVDVPGLAVPANGRGFNPTQSTSMEMDHCRFVVSSSNGDKFMNMNRALGATYDALKFHHNYFYLPWTGAAGLGTDGLDWAGDGVSVYNNWFIGFNGGGVNHHDGIQFAGGRFTKIYNNVFYNFQNSGIYLDAFNNFSDCYVYNNIIQNTRTLGNGSIVAGNDGGGFSWTRVVIANNICQGGAFAVSLTLNGLGGSETDCHIWNNYSISGSFSSIDPAVDVSHNVGPNSALTSGFVAWANADTNNNFHLNSSATSFIGQALNASAYFTIDKDGNTRGTPWDIGPYAFSTNIIANTNAIISVQPSLDF